ncbi:MAG: tetratricopeptide repeat protein [Elusimicrobiota bacterium]|nr:tetratricopeptide repeat protein [Elusimicrobiota bacterium]
MPNTTAAREAMKNGEFFLERGDLRKAGLFFGRALCFDGGLVQAELHLAQIALRSGDTAKAELHADRALAGGPGIAHAHYLKARILAQKGERAGALCRLKKAVGLSPGFEDAGRLMFLLANNPGWNPRGTDMLDSWQMAIEAGKKPDLGKMRRALLDFVAATGAGLSPQLFKAYCMLGYYKKACETLSLLSSPREARARLCLLDVANPWCLEHRLPAAYFIRHKRDLEKTKACPGLEGSLAYLSHTLAINFHGPRKEAALKGLAELAEKEAGRYGFAGYVSGWRSLDSGRYDAAISGFQKSLSSGYRHFVVQCSLGEALLCKGRIRAGMEKFKAACSSAAPGEKESVRAWEGEMLLFMRKYREAARLLKSNGSRHAACWLGAAYLGMGKLKNAVAELEKGVAADPEDAEARTWLGEAYRRCGLYPGALRELELAGRLSDGRNIWVYLNRALIFSGSGDASKIKRSYEAAASTWPELLLLAREGLGMDGGETLNGPEMIRVIEHTLKMCGGYRRPEKHFLPLAVQGAGLRPQET